MGFQNLWWYFCRLQEGFCRRKDDQSCGYSKTTSLAMAQIVLISVDQSAVSTCFNTAIERGLDGCSHRAVRGPFCRRQPLRAFCPCSQGQCQQGHARDLLIHISLRWCQWLQCTGIQHSLEVWAQIVRVGSFKLLSYCSCFLKKCCETPVFSRRSPWPKTWTPHQKSITMSLIELLGSTVWGLVNVWPRHEPFIFWRDEDSFTTDLEP